jgi:hypothetical protein
VDDGIGTGHGSPNGIGRTQVSGEELDAEIAQRPLALGLADDRDDVIAAFTQSARHARPDEPGGAGDEDRPGHCAQ